MSADVAVRSLAQVLDVFERRGVERRDVTCGYCKQSVERVAKATARKWFVEHDCIGAPQRPRVSRDERDQERMWSCLAWLLTERPSGGSWREMTVTTRYYGGHRTRLGKPTEDHFAHGDRVDAILTRILGGVPTGKPPATSAVVIPFPCLADVADRVAA